MIEILIEKPVGELRERLHFVEEEIAKLEREIHDSAKALPFLQNGLNDLLNEYHLRAGQTRRPQLRWTPSSPSKRGSLKPASKPSTD